MPIASGNSASKLRPIEAARVMRDEGATWVAIAAALRERHGVSALVAMRWAHSWSQSKAAEQWTWRWPSEPKTSKAFSYWERWEHRGGDAPSLPILCRLAELYECRVEDLLSDLPDYRHKDQHYPPRRPSPPPQLPPSRKAIGTRLDGLLDDLADGEVDEIAAAVLTWARPHLPLTYVQPVLMKLCAGLGLAAQWHTSLPLTDAEVEAVREEKEGPVSRRPERSRFMGIWRSRWDCASARRDGSGAAPRFIVLREHRGRLLGHSLPHATGVHIRLELSVDGSTVSGTWREYDGATTSRSGASYGCVQLELDPSGRAMHGRWLGFGPGVFPIAGTWELTWMTDALSGRALRHFQAAA